MKNSTTIYFIFDSLKKIISATGWGFVWYCGCLLFDVFVLFEQLVTKHACFCLAFSPSPIPCLSNAAGAEENKRAGVEEAEVEAGLSDHKCLLLLDMFSPEYIGKIYQLAYKYIEHKKTPPNIYIIYIFLWKNNTNKLIEFIWLLWMLKIIKCEKNTQLFYSFYSFLWSYSVTMLK